MKILPQVNNKDSKTRYVEVALESLSILNRFSSAKKVYFWILRYFGYLTNANGKKVRSIPAMTESFLQSNTE